MKKELTDGEIEVTILDKLARRGKWGRYLPTTVIIRDISHKIKKDGKRVKRIMDQLGKNGLIWQKKSGEVTALNPHRKSEILEKIKHLYSTITL